ncbi:TPA: hypothetical protein HA249_03900 [Candidatus Woesearchaeota archaeon]|nr:hypothetical protein [Candidatus Woesearchaeota archaeon]HII88358.1 hypothetical protein [Candidatus Woesearchaeota archaeon]
MAITATITYDDLRLYDVIQQEVFKTQRTGFDVKKEGNQVVMTVHASDASAFRAAINSITQTLTVYQKLRGNHD